MSLTTKEILNFAKEIYTKQYSAAYPNEINSEIFPQLISKILKVFETRIVNYEKLIKNSEREWGYRRIQLDAAVVISLLKYFFYNDKNSLYRTLPLQFLSLFFQVFLQIFCKSIFTTKSISKNTKKRMEGIEVDFTINFSKPLIWLILRGFFVRELKK